MLRRTIMTVAVAGMLAGGFSSPARASDYASEAGWGLLTILANVGYIPTKLVYATLGGLTGALAYPVTVGNTDVVQGIWSPSLGGTYVLSTPMLQGEQPILFSGENFDPTERNRGFVEEPTSVSTADLAE